jgi:GxxExxY protein
MRENEIAAHVFQSALTLHRELGPGLFESVYERALAFLLEERGLHVARQASIPFEYRGRRFNDGFRADLLVDDLVIVEVKSVDGMDAVHRKQLLTYLRVSGRKLGLLVNFGQARLTDGFERMANGL